MKLIRRIIDRFYCKIAKRSSISYLNYLRNKGVKIGEGTVVKDPRHILIDSTRPSLLEIGSHVFLHKDMTILTHDWTGWCFVEMYNEFIPSHKRTIIGDNIWFGEGVKVLSGVKIGSNTIIGAYSVVTRDIPENSVAVGVPCRRICSIEEYYRKRREVMLQEIRDYACSIKERFDREPNIDDFYDDYPAFVDGHNYNEYKYPYEKIFNKQQFELWKEKYNAVYNGFDDFIKDIDK